MIKKYNTFKENLAIDEVLNESRIYYSKPLKKILSSIDNNIASDLLDIAGEDIKADITFVNNDKSDGYFSFITMKNAENILKSKYSSETSDYIANKKSIDLANRLWDVYYNGENNGVYAKSRNDIRIGKFVNSVLPGKYTTAQIEEFVNLYKASVDKLGEKFELISGKEIDKWYWHENYLKQMGTLGSSCMRAKRGIFSLYNENPEVCRLLILKENDKLLGRALVWKIDSIDNENINTKYIMDRIYTIRDSDVIKFQKFAEEQEWAYKARNTYVDKQAFIYKGSNYKAKATVKVANIKYETFPFVDTFSRFNPATCELFNDDESSKYTRGQYILHHTDGTFIRIPGELPVPGMVYSEWEERNIPEVEAVFSEPLDMWILRNDSVYIEVGSPDYIGWYPSAHAQIRYSNYDNRYIHSNDSVWCESINSYILRRDAVKVIEFIDLFGTVKIRYRHHEDKNYVDLGNVDLSWPDKISDSCDFILKDLLIDNSNGQKIPKILSVELYRVKDEDIMISKLDAGVLDYEIDESKMIIVDQYQYHEMIDEMLDELTKRLRELLDILTKRIKRSVSDKNIQKNTTILMSIKERLMQISEFAINNRKYNYYRL